MERNLFSRIENIFFVIVTTHRDNYSSEQIGMDQTMLFPTVFDQFHPKGYPTKNGKTWVVCLTMGGL